MTRLERSLMLLLTLLPLAACTAARPKPEASQGAPLETPPLRAPANSETDERLEVTFETLLNSPDPAQRFRDYFGRVVSIYLYADAVVHEFDDALDEAARAQNPNPALLESPQYKRVRALWSLTVREHEKIEYIYRRLIETERGTDTLRSSAARRVRVEFENYLFRHSGIERIALHDVLLSVNEIREGFGLRTRRIADPKTHLIEIQKLRPALTQKSLYERQSNEALKAEMEGLVSLADARENTRIPQSDEALIHPDPGKAGNIVGGNFPAGTWALTYDDGPSGKFTPLVLKNLADNQLKATFFWLAQNASQSSLAPIVKQAQERGMVVANHSWSHANLPKLGTAGLNHEIFESTEKLIQVYGGPFRFFRCPYGAGMNNTRIRQMIAEKKLIHVFWNVDSLDWQDKNPVSVLARVKKQMALEKQGVVLFHDIHPQSVEASRMLMEWSKSQPFRWVTLDEIVDELNAKAKAAPIN